MFTVHIEDLYCFDYKSTSEDLSKTSGWDLFNLVDEYKRMRVPNEEWVLCTANQNYEVCYYIVIINGYCTINTIHIRSFVTHIHKTCLFLRRHLQRFWQVALVLGHGEDFQYYLIYTTTKQPSLDVHNL